MASINLFDVDTTLLRQYIFGLILPIPADATPTESEWTAIIRRQAGLACARAEQAGMNVSQMTETATPQMWQIMQELICLSVARHYYQAQERTDPTILERYESRIDKAWDRMTAEIGSNGDGQTTNADRALYVDSHVTQQAQVAQSLRGQSLANRMAWSGRV